MARAALTPALQLSVRAAVAGALSVATAQYLQLGPFPICALVVAVLVTDRSARQTRDLALPRVAGTMLGAATGALLSEVMPSNAIVIGFGILVAMLLSHLLRLQGAARVAGLVSGIVILCENGHPWSYACRRVIETTLGISFAVLVSFIPKLIATDERDHKSKTEQGVDFPKRQ